MGLLDVLGGGMSNAQSGQRTAGSGGGMSPITKAIIGVIAYQAIKNLATKYLDLKELGTMVGFNHIITGGTQYVKNKIRINIQIIDSRNYKQIWSRIFESKVTPTNLFDIQDEICQQTILQAQGLVNE